MIGKIGDKAFLDGIEGLVPCTVLAITEKMVRVKMQARKGVWSWQGGNPYGDWSSEEEWPHSMVIPSKAIRWPRGKGRFFPIIFYYTWERSG